MSAESVRRHADQPVLITAAARSFEEEFAARKRRYALIMGARIPCLVLAGVFGIGFGWTLAAVLLIVASVPLPWMAVLIANDGPPRKAEKVARYRRERRQVESAEHRVIEPVEVLGTDPAGASRPAHPSGSAHPTEPAHRTEPAHPPGSAEPTDDRRAA